MMTIRKKVLIVLGSVLVLVTLLCGVCAYMFMSSQYGTQHLAQDYYLLRRRSGISIGARWTDPGYITVVTPDVIDLDWDREFIVVKQDPREMPGVPDTGIINWYIIDIADYEPFASRLEPLSYEEYLEMRKVLSVSSKLGLLEPGQEPWEVYEHKYAKDD